LCQDFVAPSLMTRLCVHASAPGCNLRTLRLPRYILVRHCLTMNRTCAAHFTAFDWQDHGRVLMLLVPHRSPKWTGPYSHCAGVIAEPANQIALEINISSGDRPLGNAHI